MTNDEIRELGLLIEGLKLKEQPDGSKDFHPYIYELVRAALARACQPQWISVDERLPENDGPYLLHYPNELHDRQIGWFNSHIRRFNFYHDHASHWMPLPELPKGE